MQIGQRPALFGRRCSVRTRERSRRCRRRRRRCRRRRRRHPQSRPSRTKADARFEFLEAQRLFFLPSLQPLLQWTLRAPSSRSLVFIAASQSKQSMAQKSRTLKLSCRTVCNSKRVNSQSARTARRSQNSLSDSDRHIQKIWQRSQEKNARFLLLRVSENAQF